MTREEKIERMKTEYMLRKIDEDVTSYPDLIEYLNYEDAELISHYQFVLRAIRHDTFDLYKTRVLNYLFGILGFEEEDDTYLVKDIEALNKFGESISVYELLYQRLIANATEDNWKDIYVLAEFMGDNFSKTYDYYTRVIAGIEVSYQGIVCVAGGEDEMLIFREVFEEEFQNILLKSKEKVKSGFNGEGKNHVEI